MLTPNQRHQHTAANGDEREHHQVWPPRFTRIENRDVITVVVRLVKYKLVTAIPMGAGVMLIFSMRHGLDTGWSRPAII
jgi:hypothetical protein